MGVGVAPAAAAAGGAVVGWAAAAGAVVGFGAAAAGAVVGAAAGGAVVDAAGAQAAARNALAEPNAVSLRKSRLLVSLGVFIRTNLPSLVISRQRLRPA